MSASDVIAELTRIGCTLTTKDGALRVIDSNRRLTDDLRDAIRENKEVLLMLLELYEERAAIMEYCAGLPRTDAERQAWEAVLDHSERRVDVSGQ